MGGVEREFILKHVEQAPPDDAFLCKKNTIKAKRNHTKPGFIHKWKPQSDRKLQKCMNPRCTHVDYKPSFRPVEDICEVLGVCVDTNDILLCPKCYQEVYHKT